MTDKPLQVVDGERVQMDASAASPAQPGQPKRILFVDDEHLVLKLSCRMLERLGMETQGFLSGGEGILFACDAANQIDILFLDVMLADMSGFDVYEEVRKIRADLPVIFISGYCSQETLQQTLESDDNVTFLPKPFSIDQLALAISA